ncbi:recQ-mediated genome instability protein 1-like [Oppia nitens]|uniref:recQ-mediated genome instability protein 1-like n=1 Tax=Oppia nitens TaxID=1686743 RepID=UPI0023D9A408|nr:recQ-mediated genome instability protein 1-like [Oppia nitens]
MSAVVNTIRLQPLKEYLKKRFIAVSDQWLTTVLTANTDVTNEMVYQQWLNTDIGQTSPVSQLPTDCSQIKLDNSNRKPVKMTINNKYAVQINSIEDISRPKILSETDALDDDLSSENSDEDSENRSSTMFKRQKAKPKKVMTKKGARVLSMILSDGITQCKAIEYKPIDSLSIATPVGSKLLLSGPIDIYSAVMLLNSKHVTVLGGSIPIPDRTTNRR